MSEVRSPDRDGRTRPRVGGLARRAPSGGLVARRAGAVRRVDRQQVERLGEVARRGRDARRADRRRERHEHVDEVVDGRAALQREPGLPAPRRRRARPARPARRRRRARRSAGRGPRCRRARRASAGCGPSPPGTSRPGPAAAPRPVRLLSRSRRARGRPTSLSSGSTPSSSTARPGWPTPCRGPYTRLMQMAPATAVATSLDGRRFGFEAPLRGHVFEPGGYVAIGGDGGAARPGARGRDRAPRRRRGWPRARARSSTAAATRSPTRRSCRRAPERVAAWLERCGRRAPALAVGELALAPGVPLVLDAGGFDRHTFLCGQSGSGKTYALGGVLERLLAETGLRLVILDPNSDHVRLGEVREGVDPGRRRALPRRDAGRRRALGRRRGREPAAPALRPPVGPAPGGAAAARPDRRPRRVRRHAGPARRGRRTARRCAGSRTSRRRPGGRGPRGARAQPRGAGLGRVGARGRRARSTTSCGPATRAASSSTSAASPTHEEQALDRGGDAGDAVGGPRRRGGRR